MQARMARQLRSSEAGDGETGLTGMWAQVEQQQQHAHAQQHQHQHAIQRTATFPSGGELLLYNKLYFFLRISLQGLKAVYGATGI